MVVLDWTYTFPAFPNKTMRDGNGRSFVTVLKKLTTVESGEMTVLQENNRIFMELQTKSFFSRFAVTYFKL
jgi:hypothetical protein